MDVGHLNKREKVEKVEKVAKQYVLHSVLHKCGAVYGVDVDHLKKCEKVEEVEQCRWK